MGRTLHYSITFPRKPTDNQMEKISNLCGRYCTLADLTQKSCFKWTCEYPSDFIEYYPNWSRTNWDEIAEEYNKLENSGMSRLKILKKLYNDGYILPVGNGFWFETKYLRAFTKVAGNELNALMLYLYLVDVSCIVPKAEIRLSDEGEFLFAPVIIKAGKTKIDYEKLDDLLKYYETDTYYMRTELFNFDKGRKIETGVKFGRVYGFAEHNGKLVFRLLEDGGYTLTSNTFYKYMETISKYSAEDKSRYNNSKQEYVIDKYGNSAKGIRIIRTSNSIVGVKYDPIYRDLFINLIIKIEKFKKVFGIEYDDPDLFHRPVVPEDFEDYPEFQIIGIDENTTMEEISEKSKIVLAGNYGEYWDLDCNSISKEMIDRNSYIISLINETIQNSNVK